MRDIVVSQGDQMILTFQQVASSGWIYQVDGEQTAACTPV
jgi:hypothetical protein